ncbi:hypothetical protein [Thermoanaerobacterium sp. RBIITD]|uniref:hypothetical protein n=1 Tax=Thermoanaerobacterium sp. RBIITD TaxID=1550240 RepID=UPI0018D50AE0|nr:hypothetical protein [Thermoanaerobacterium sp. RBIITD]
MFTKEALKMTANAYKNSNFDKAILAVGSCEKHGEALAIGNRYSGIIKSCIENRRKSRRTSCASSNINRL